MGSFLSNAVPQPPAATGSAGTATSVSRADHAHRFPTAAEIGAASTSHTHVAADVTDFNSVSRTQTVATLIAGTNITLTPAGSGASQTLTIAASGGGSAPSPVTLTGSTSLTEASHANRDLFVNSGSAVTLTLPLFASTPIGTKFYGVNEGAGAISFATSGGNVLQADAILPSTVAQWNAFEIRRGSTAWVRIA